MTVNETLLRQTVEEIEDHQDHWKQSAWVELVNPTDPACGTTLCFAGFASCLAGAEFVPPEEQSALGGVTWYYQPPQVVTPEGDVRHAEDYAQEVLGLDSEQAWSLFHRNYENDMDVLRDTVDRIISGEISEDNIA